MTGIEAEEPCPWRGHFTRSKVLGADPAGLAATRIEKHDVEVLALDAERAGRVVMWARYRWINPAPYCWHLETELWSAGPTLQLESTDLERGPDAATAIGPGGS